MPFVKSLFSNTYIVAPFFWRLNLSTRKLSDSSFCIVAQKTNLKHKYIAIEMIGRTKVDFNPFSTFVRWNAQRVNGTRKKERNRYAWFPREARAAKDVLSVQARLSELSGEQCWTFRGIHSRHHHNYHYHYNHHHHHQHSQDDVLILTLYSPTLAQDHPDNPLRVTILPALLALSICAAQVFSLHPNPTTRAPTENRFTIGVRRFSEGLRFYLPISTISS